VSNVQYPSNQPGFVPSAQPFAQSPTGHTPHYQPQPSYGTGYGTPGNVVHSTPSYPAQPSSLYQSITPSPQHATQSAQPPMMGPPMRWGFESQAFSGAHHGQGHGVRGSGSYGHGEKFGRQGNKRDHVSAFGKPQSTTPRVPAPPPVPSFGNPLPSKPPASVDAARKPKKKKRRHNQLGLTPKAEEHESSEEEDDVDEESKFAAAGNPTVTTLQFTYKGRTSTLQSPSDIAAWIEERKKRFPTQAKIEERKNALAEAKKAREEALRQKDQRKQEARAQQEREKQSRQAQQKTDTTNPADVAEKAKRRAEKLRRKLMREEQRLAKAEADAERARQKVEALQKESTEGPDGAAQDETGEHGQTTDDTPTVPAAENIVGTPVVEDQLREEPVAGPSIPLPSLAVTEEIIPSLASSDTSDNGDWTSSSGSDLSSSSESEDSEEDAAPEEASSRRQQPERVPPPQRGEIKKRPCRHFARNGRCTRGDNCRFSHEMPDRSNAKAKATEKKGRKGLLQALLDRQKQDEDRKVMQAIMWLGENGVLDEPETSSSTHPP
ncbi:hypothetical protein ASPZODRAFT_43282, partial [Penicilliopsis zonata CBS 506.65]